jgi:hypothetical protein
MSKPQLLDCYDPSFFIRGAYCSEELPPELPIGLLKAKKISSLSRSDIYQHFLLGFSIEIQMGIYGASSVQLYECSCKSTLHKIF